MRWLAPIALRTPTSFALSMDREVAKFMKLTQAMKSINRPMIANMYRFCTLPVTPGCLPAAECI